jgi:hypothetical protein
MKSYWLNKELSNKVQLQNRVFIIELENGVRCRVY